MLLSNRCLEHVLCEMWKTTKIFCTEVRLASMMHVPSPRALCVGTLCALMHPVLFKTRIRSSKHVSCFFSSLVNGFSYE